MSSRDIYVTCRKTISSVTESKKSTLTHILDFSRMRSEAWGFRSKDIAPPKPMKAKRWFLDENADQSYRNNYGLNRRNKCQKEQIRKLGDRKREG
ncbi:hypothetical protein CEXT_787551 [Caerostris extrusa]|uniref:Uncharacterized protein n=1 Tax=Caerostris extrusa TaxID=172846 RepID=A0AAV4SJ67_CAEEX|nr:hypothetical protein CEXT_787551 [Caerostris extrusa]